MVLLKAIILLLVTIVLVQCSFEDQKVQETIKKVGKRFHTKIFGFEFGKPDFDRPAYKNLVVPENFGNKTKSEMFEFKWNVMKVMGDDIYQQYNPKDTVRYNHELNLFAILDDELVVEVCHTGLKMNKYQFTQYIQRDRAQYLQKEARLSNYHSIDKKKDNDTYVFIFMQNMVFESHYKFPVVQRWKVTAKLKKTDIGSLFKITHIKIGGTCFDYGNINHNFTLLGWRDNRWDLLKKETNPDVQALTDVFTDGPEYAEKVPVKWLDALVDNEKDLTIVVCTRKFVIPRFRREDFLAWYKRFSMMWHPVRNGTEDFLRVQVMDTTPGDKLFARVTMRLQMGSNVNSTDIFDWDFKVITKYNEHGDGKWYIKRLEVMCPLNYEPLTVSLRHIRDVVTESLLEPVEYKNGTMPFYATVEYMRKFTKNGTLETYFCDVERTFNLNQLRLMLWYNRERRIGRIFSYAVNYDDIPHPAEVDSYFRMGTHTYIKPKPPKKTTALYIHDWKFHLKWDEQVQFYYLSKLEIDCPRAIGDPGIIFKIKLLLGDNGDIPM
ncbi:unnamed protein product [Caenorhabditis brenneri]